MFMDEMSRPIIFMVDILFPKMLFIEDLALPILFKEDISRPNIFIEDMSRPIMLFMEDISLSKMFIVDMPRPIKLLALFMFDVSWLFLCFMLEDMSRPIWLLLIRCMLLSFLKDLESMYEVILVLMRSGSTEVSASRLIYFPVLSAVSLRMWNPWLSAM